MKDSPILRERGTGEGQEGAWGGAKREVLQLVRTPAARLAGGNGLRPNCNTLSLSLVRQLFASQSVSFLWDSYH